MMYALDKIGSRQEAKPDARATCPGCYGDVLAKCGSIVSWHWAHIAADCDPWTEPETPWHRGWKEAVPEPQREVVMGAHRADIVTITGWVVELQSRSLPAGEARQREDFYGHMVWIFNLSEVAYDRFLVRDHDGYATFRWKHPWKSLALLRAPVLLDLWGRTSDQVFALKRIYPDAPCGGWGRVVAKSSIIEWMNDQK